MKGSLEDAVQNVFQNTVYQYYLLFPLISILLKIFIVPLEIHKHTMVFKTVLQCGNEHQHSSYSTVVCRKLLYHPMTPLQVQCYQNYLLSALIYGLHFIFVTLLNNYYDFTIIQKGIEFIY